MNNQSRHQGYFPASFFRRTDRLVLDDTGYHYRIRKGKAVGPFPTEKAAYRDLRGYIKLIPIDESLSSVQN